MPIEIAGINLNRIHKLATLEVADFSPHRIPGLNGTVVQGMGRESVRLQIDGIFFGNDANDNLESLRDIYKSQEPVDFLADIVGQAYFSQVIIERFEVNQAAAFPDQYSYSLYIAEYVPPPEPISGFEDVGLDIGLEALDFMDMIQLPDILSLPDLFDPTQQLSSILDGVGGVLGPLGGEGGPAQQLSTVFSEPRGRSMMRGPGGGASIFVNIDISLNVDGLQGMIGGQLNFLDKVGLNLDQLNGQPPTGIVHTAGFLGEASLPDLDIDTVLKTEFEVIRPLIPIDASLFVGGLDAQLESFFANLNVDMTFRITGVLEAFAAIHALIELGHPLAKEENSDEAEARFRAFRNPEESDPVIDALKAIQDHLHLIPDSVEDFLNWMLVGLQKIPREQIELRYLPLIDELRDKLETVLAWAEMSGPEIGKHMADSIRKMEQAIQRNFYENGITHLIAPLHSAGSLIDPYTLASTLDELRSGLQQLGQFVQAQEMEEATLLLQQLQSQKALLDSRLRSITSQLFEGQTDRTNRDLTFAVDFLEDRMLQLISDLNPPSDLPILTLIIGPVNKVLDDVGLNSLTDRLKEVLGTLRSYIDKLNLRAIKDSLGGALNDATGALNDLRDLIIQSTVEITVALNTVEQAIDDVGIEALLATVQGALEDFQQLIEDGVNSTFGPVRDTLLSSFSQINDLLIAFNPAVLAEELQRMLAALTSVLTEPTLVASIDGLRSALDSVNAGLGKFTFRPSIDVTVDGIGTVESGLKIAAKLPMPDSIKGDLKKALNQIPATIDPIVVAINEAMSAMVSASPKPVLLAIRDQPAKLVKLVESFSPAEYVGENITKPYQKVLVKMEGFDLKKLIKPIEKELNKLKATVAEELDPVRLLNPLEPTFQELSQQLDKFNPAELIQPIQEKLSEGIQSITDNIPLDIADEAFEQIAKVVKQIQSILNKAKAFRDLLADIQSRLAGLKDAEEQVRTFGDKVASQLEQLDDLDAFFEAIEDLNKQLDKIKREPLQAPLDQAIDLVVAQIEVLKPQERLVDLIGTHRTFPTTALENLPPSQTRDDISNFIKSFDPLDELYSFPLNKLEDWRGDLTQIKTQIQEDFSDWDQRYHSANSPLNDLRNPGVTLTNIKDLLRDTVNQQLTETLAPYFRLIDHLQAFFDVILVELIELIDAVDAQVQEIAQVGAALAELQEAIHNLVEALENFDLQFLEKEINDLFEAVKEKLQALSPLKLAANIQTTLDNLLAIIDLDALLGIDELEAEYQLLIDFLKANDPGRLLAEVVQPEYDKIPEFLKRFDFSEPIDTFIALLEGLQLELEVETTRLADAYAKMISAVPSEFTGSLSASVNVNISAG